MAETNQQQLYAMVYEVVRDIPSGTVATYGQIARLIGLPCHARHVGFALSRLADDNNVPWHRVVNAQGKIHLRCSQKTSRHQQKLLEDEGVFVSSNHRVVLKKYQWNPKEIK